MRARPPAHKKRMERMESHVCFRKQRKASETQTSVVVGQFRIGTEEVEASLANPPSLVRWEPHPARVQLAQRPWPHQPQKLWLRAHRTKRGARFGSCMVFLPGQLAICNRERAG